MTEREQRALAAGLLALLPFIGFIVAIGSTPISTRQAIAGFCLIAMSILIGMAGAYLDKEAGDK